MKSVIAKLGAMPHESKRTLKRLLYFFSLERERDKSVPPKWLRFHSGVDHEAVGKHLFELCRDYGGLKSSDDVLDIGCGVGRAATPIIDALGPDGSYHGFDIDKEAIAWCRNNITTGAPPITFTEINVGNDHYRRHGEGNARTSEFPCESDSVDLALATSVFTHLYGDEASNYLKETFRVLRPGGTALTTWYMVNPEKVGNRGEPDNRFFHSVDANSFTSAPTNPCAAMAFSDIWISAAAAEAGLEIVGTPLRGQWRHESGPTYQDLLILRKPT